MSLELAKLVIGYFSVSLLFLVMFTYGPLDLETPPKYEKHKDLLIVLFSIFWINLILVFINTIIRKRGDR